MDRSIVLAKGFCLPQPSLEGLIQGRIIAALPSISLRQKRDSFALVPVCNSSSETISILAWATCEAKEYLEDLPAEEISSISYLTEIGQTDLETRLANKGRLFLCSLRVYHLPEPKEISLANLEAISQKEGKFIALKEHRITVGEKKPVLSDRLFSQRQQQLENRLPPEHPQLEALPPDIQSIPHPNPAAAGLEPDLNHVVGNNKNNSQAVKSTPSDWIKTITALGNRIKELDQGKSNYQAGTDFENIVKKSLEFLGYTIDKAHKGGPGGLDIFCSQPYPLVIECKSGKKIPNSTAIQLLYLANSRLDQASLSTAVKLIIGPGKPTSQLNSTAQASQIAIINPETLEKLVELQAKYPNSLDLWQLKADLKPGKSDSEVLKYIERVYEEIRVRSHVVELVKNHLEKTNSSTVGIGQLYGAYVASQAPQSLTQEQLKEILIELSSPLAGYLGRDGEGFYFLRELRTADERR